MSHQEIASDAIGQLFAEYLRTGDRELRNELVEAHRPLAEFYASRYANRGVPQDDLCQVALLSIFRAIDRFDPRQGVAFSTFASRTIEGELKRYFRDRTWLVKPPRRAQEMHLALRHADEELCQRLGRSPSVEELAAELNESIDRVHEAIEAGSAHVATSLDSAPGDNDLPTASRRVLARDDVGYTAVDEKLAVDELLARLPEREQRVIRLRFYSNMSQEEIAEEIGVSQSYLSRILRRALFELRKGATTDVWPD